MPRVWLFLKVDTTLSSPAVRIKIIVNSMATIPEREPEGSDDH
jgi:hypothetical protein